MGNLDLATLGCLGLLVLVSIPAIAVRVRK